MSDTNEPNPVEPVASPPVDGRRIQGEGLEHEQDAVVERIIYGSSTNEYAEASEQIKEVSAEIDELTRRKTGE